MDRLIKLLQREIENIDHNILIGACPDYATYTAQLARRGAFMEAIAIIKKAFVSDEDEEEELTQ
jgi:hypothetical protein